MTSPIPWHESQKLRAYAGAELAAIVGWAMASLSNNVWDWKQLAISTLCVVLLIVNDWRGSDIVAPFAAMNRNNALPASSIPKT